MLSQSEQARVWLLRVERREVAAAVPDLAWSECGNALARYVRAGLVKSADGVRALRLLSALPLRTLGTQPLAEPALLVALERGLSVYDACYVVLAEARGAVLVTADRRLAAAVPRAELLA